MQESTPLDNISEISNVLKTKNIVPSKLTFGFIGLGKIGSGIVKNLLNSGHKVNIWNRTPDKVNHMYFQYLYYKSKLKLFLLRTKLYSFIMSFIYHAYEF